MAVAPAAVGVALAGAPVAAAAVVVVVAVAEAPCSACTSVAAANAVAAAGTPGRGVLRDAHALARSFRQVLASARAWEWRFRAEKAADLLL